VLKNKFKIKAHPGFSLLEVILSFLISAILGTILFTALYQIQKSAKIANSTMNLDMKVAVLEMQLSRDLSCAFLIEKEPETKFNNNFSNNYKKNKLSKRKNDFFAINDKNNLKELSFISTNLLPVYNLSRQSIGRVIYELKPDLDIKNSYNLFRSESLSLDYDVAKKSKKYVIIDKVKSIKMNYYFLDKNNKNNNSKKFKSEPFGEFEQLPAYISLDISLWEDASQKSSREFKLNFKIYSFNNIKEKSNNKNHKIIKPK